MQRRVSGHDSAGVATGMQMDAVTRDALADAGQQVDAVRVVLPQGQAMHGQGFVMADDVGGPGARDGQPRRVGIARSVWLKPQMPAST